MKFLLSLMACLLPLMAFSQGGPIIRTPLTTNNMMNAPQDFWIPIWNDVAKKWSNGVNTASATNNAQPPSTTLSNLTATGVSPGATNASAYIGSSSGLGTNTDIKVTLEVFGSAFVSTNITASNNITALGDITASGTATAADFQGGGFRSSGFSNGDRALVTDVGPNASIVESVVTANELGYLSGVTSSLQPQINNRIANMNGRGTNTTLVDFTSLSGTNLTIKTNGALTVNGVQTNHGGVYVDSGIVGGNAEIYLVNTNDDAFAQLWIRNWNADNSSLYLAGARGNPGAPAASGAGDLLGQYYSIGRADSQDKTAFSLRGYALNNWSDADSRGLLNIHLGYNNADTEGRVAVSLTAYNQTNDVNVHVKSNLTVLGALTSDSTNVINSLSEDATPAPGAYVMIEDVATATLLKTPVSALTGGGIAIQNGAGNGNIFTNLTLIGSSHVFNGFEGDFLYAATGTEELSVGTFGSGLSFDSGTGIVIATGAGGGGAGTLPMNANQFDTNNPVTIKNGALLTNTSVRTALTLPTLTASRASLINGSNQLTNSANVTDTELEFLDGVTSAIQTQINNRQGGSAVLSNLVGTVANNVTNENSGALQINAGVMSLTPGVLSNIVASGHGAPYIAVSTNGGTLANVTSIVFRAGVVLSNDSAGIASIHVAASAGSGSTNNVTTGEHFTTISNQLYRAPMNLGDTTNIVASFRTNQYIVAPSNSFTITVADLPQSGHKATVELFVINTNSAGGFFVTNGLNGGSVILLSSPSTNRFLITSQTNALWVESGQILATGLSDVFVMQTNATIATATNINPTIQDVSGDKFRFDVGAPSDSQALVFHPGSSGTILTNGAASGGGGPTTNAPPYTVPITGTNFILDWIALGSTNDVILTNYAAAGLLNTNILPGKVIRATVIQGSQGFCTIVPNTNHFGPNFRLTAVQTGIVQSTNGGYEDFIVLYGSRTNAVLSGQNWGAAP